MKVGNGGLAYRVTHGRIPHHHVVYRATEIVLALADYAETARRISLRIYVHDEYFVPHKSDERAEVDTGGRLSDASLLIGYCDDFCHGTASRTRRNRSSADERTQAAQFNSNRMRERLSRLIDKTA